MPLRLEMAQPWDQITGPGSWKCRGVSPDRDRTTPARTPGQCAVSELLCALTTDLLGSRRRTLLRREHFGPKVHPLLDQIASHSPNCAGPIEMDQGPRRVRYPLLTRHHGIELA